MYANKLTESKSRYSSFISSLETSLYEKDYITAEHAVRVRDLCIRFGIELKLNDSIIDELTVLASLHDIGKITIPASILRKNGPLTDEEWKIVRQHPETGYRITRVTHGMGFIAEDILCHHERWDGKGYPQGLSGDQIPLASRILSVIDTFDVITHDRPYKEAFSEREALNEIRKCSGSQFDPQIADAFISFFEQSVLKI
jgi:HD-GYP domain-containing protein (c-di-GMP phosphodiesterase class II)